VKIVSLAVRRFKQFEDSSFDLRGHVVLAGPNNCGKTTVLQAVAAWSLALARWKELNDYQRHGGGYTKAPLSRLAFSAVPLRSFELLWCERNYGGSIEIEIGLDSGGSVTMEIIADTTEQVYVRPRKDVPPDRLRQVKADVVYLATVGGLSVSEPVYQRDYIETLLGQQRPGDVVRNLLWQVSIGNSWGKLTSAVQRLFGIELQVPQTPGGVITCEYRRLPNGCVLDILSGGSGFQQVLMLLAALYSRESSIILVDEPDAHLHVFLQDTIFAELNRAAIENGCQLILATHSEVIFNSVEPDCICLMVGERPRRLIGHQEVRSLQRAMGVLQQSDLVSAGEAPGVLYLEGYTDLNLLREWARVLGHPLSEYLNRSPFWRPVVTGPGDGVEGVSAAAHFDALKLANSLITGVWILDSDGKSAGIPVSISPERGSLNRAAWQRYEAESYLVHPTALERFAEQVSGHSCRDAINGFFEHVWGHEMAENFRANPLAPVALIENYLRTTKARTEIIGGALAAAGVHGLSHTEFAGIAAVMLPEEIHPEVREKLDFIQQAFGL
jgi:energy-coupling factor transporter ATP-binding protein EcfA2